MKRKIIILVALAVFLTSSAVFAATTENSASKQLALERVEYTAATVTVSRLNVREGPSTSYNSPSLKRVRL